MSCCTKKSYDSCKTDEQGRTVCCTTETVIHTSPEFSELETREEHCEILTDAEAAEQMKKHKKSATAEKSGCSCGTKK